MVTVEVTNGEALLYLDSNVSLTAKPLHRVTKGRSGGGGGGGGNSSSKKLEQEKEPSLVKTCF